MFPKAGPTRDNYELKSLCVPDSLPSGLTLLKCGRIDGSGLQAHRTASPGRHSSRSAEVQGRLTQGGFLVMNTWRLRIMGLPHQDASGTDASIKAGLKDGHLISIWAPSASSGLCFPSREQERAESHGHSLSDSEVHCQVLYIPFLITFLSDLIFKLATVPWVTSTTRKEQLLRNMLSD